MADDFDPDQTDQQDTDAPSGAPMGLPEPSPPQGQPDVGDYGLPVEMTQRARAEAPTRPTPTAQVDDLGNPIPGSTEPVAQSHAGYFQRNEAMPDAQYDAESKKFDPKGEMSVRERHLQTIANQEDPTNKMGAILTGAKRYDTGRALARVASDEGNDYQSVGFFQHASDYVPALHDTAVTQTRDGVTVTQGQQVYNLRPDQWKDFLHSNDSHFDMIQRNGLGDAIARVTRDRSPVGAQGPGSNTPAVDETQQSGVGAEGPGSTNETPVRNTRPGEKNREDIAGLRQSPVEQGAQQFRRQIPAGTYDQSQNPNGRGTFIPDASNPGHGAWTGGEEGAGVEGPMPGQKNQFGVTRTMPFGEEDRRNASTPEDVRQAAEFNARHPSGGGYAVTPQSGGEPVGSVITGSKGHATTRSSKRGSTTESTSEPVSSPVAGGGAQRGGSAGLRTDDQGRTAGERSAAETDYRHYYDALQKKVDAGTELSPDQKNYVTWFEGRMHAAARGGQPQQQQSAVPPQAVQMLRSNPSLAVDFDAKYGQGASRRALGQ